MAEAVAMLPGAAAGDAGSRAAGESAPKAAAHAGVRRLALALLSSALVAVPFAVVDFPPVTDLPQHVAQIRLFLEAVRDPASPYTIQWFTPYSLSYGLIGLLWALLPPLEVGRASALILVIAWAGAAHFIAWRRGRSPAAAVCASLLAFNVALYWGFLSFAFGWIAFVVWFDLTSRLDAGRFGWRDGLAYFGAAVLLYLSHALWFAVGMGWLLVVCLVRRVPPRVALAPLASVAPAILGAAIWYPHLARSGFASETIWSVPLLHRLSFGWLVEGSLGGLQGATETLAIGFLVGWLALAAWQNRSALGTAIDRPLALLAVVLFALAFFLPDHHTSTIAFSVRWLAPALTALVLALPAPELLRPTATTAVAVGLLAVFSLSTATAWKRFERDELSGLREALAALPERPRLLGLDFVKHSEVIKGRPFLQTFAYGQVLRGGTLNFTFAGLAPSLVVYPGRVGVPWSLDLEWYAERVRPQDFAHFDFALINATEAGHQLLGQNAPITPLTAAGRWRLYRPRELRQ